MILTAIQVMPLLAGLESFDMFAFVKPKSLTFINHANAAPAWAQPQHLAKQTPCPQDRNESISKQDQEMCEKAVCEINLSSIRWDC